jgi:hypothetical protein
MYSRKAVRFMASTRRNVSLNGILTGQGLESRCVVSAVEIKHIGIGTVALSQFDIQSVTESLPEGSYELQCNGTKTTMRYKRGVWLAG